MKNKEMLREIYYENKAMNRNMQRLVNIGLLGILGRAAKEAKEPDDAKEKKSGESRTGSYSNHAGITYDQ